MSLILSPATVGNLVLKWNYLPGSGTESSPAVANGVVYIGADDRNLYALNASTGALLWKYMTGNAVYSSPAVANGVVYVGSYDKNYIRPERRYRRTLLWNIHDRGAMIGEFFTGGSQRCSLRRV